MFIGRKNKKLKRIFFATDIHGSDRVFKKFLNVPNVYGVDVLILGGDITGKLVVPIVEQSDGSYTTILFGKEITAKTRELKKLEESILLQGYYPYYTNMGEMEELVADPAKQGTLFKRLIIQRVKEWCKIIDERLRNTGVRCFVTGGNDDIFEIEPVLKKADYMVAPEGEVVWVDDHHEMISSGYGNITPWNCPRDIPEEELAEKIEVMASRVENMKNCIFNLHVPPKGSGLDTCAKLDTSVVPPRPIPGEFIDAGSTAVRKAIEKHQPLLGLHGHIHESRGAIKVGRTLCLNPGSEYAEGVLRGVIINVKQRGIVSYQFVSG